MKTLKRVLALVMALGMMFALASCGSSKDEESETKKLVMATNATFPPYEYVDGNEFAGIDVEIAQAIADKLGMELEIQDVEFGSIITGITTGKYDIGMAGMTVTPERQKSVNFTTSYATGIQSIIVKEDSEIASVDDLGKKDYMIGVQESTTGDIYASDDYGSDRVVQYKSGTDAVQALVAGKVDCVIIDNAPAKEYVAATSGLKILEAPYVTEDYAICVAKDNDELLNSVNGALEDLIADGTVQNIIDKYITAD